MILFLIIAIFAVACATGSPHQARAVADSSSDVKFVACPNDSQKQALRSEELQRIVREDQADRQIPAEKIDWNKVSAADEIRARRVAEIFAEGCFTSAKDYAAAALVFQHGVTPDHYYQAYLWSKRAVELGDQTQKQMVANAIDRYLINRGFKQLFGAQSFWGGANNCHCLAPTEEAFSESRRVKICGISLKDRVRSLKEANKENPLCEKVLYCEKDLKTPEKGLFPGIW